MLLLKNQLEERDEDKSNLLFHMMHPNAKILID